MKKLLSHITLSVLLLGSEKALSHDYFEVENTSNAIIGKLWNGVTVPAEDIQKFFELMEKPNKNEKSTLKEINVDTKQIDINKSIEIWKKDILSNVEDNNQKAIAVIQQFATEVGIIYSQNKFSPVTIKDSLSLILSKYYLG
ncbi:MAG TPA: hypothetical protein VNJ29_03640 [Candidatus Nitrosotenuis sp.]|jgi:hypothetical protein|nr:hypothetical protein [Candidatus Nitrosotenuis sp.]